MSSSQRNPPSNSRNFREHTGSIGDTDEDIGNTDHAAIIEHSFKVGA